MGHRKMTDGTVRAKNPDDKEEARAGSTKAETNVDLLEFPRVHAEAPDTPIGSEGNLLLKTEPRPAYKKDEILLYNNRKTSAKLELKVVQVNGPMKYKIKRVK
jgi:hypothetical protein